MQNETIAAISTPLGEGGIGLVRLSGPDAFAIVLKIFKKTKADLKQYPEARRLYHGYIEDSSGVKLDEVLVSFMPAPYTYTREDIVEINCHGGIFALRAVLRLVLDSGARLAEPGEYTKRAFLSGRIDMSQAEAVIAVIKARSEEAVKMAARTLDGELSSRIKAIREKIIKARAPIEASIDYPEEFHEADNPAEFIPKTLEEIKKEISLLLQGVERNRYYQEGVSIAIIGRPNVGKSSLLNAILRQQRAIVHEKPGTTRDLLDGYLNMGGYPIRLIDTAGIQGTGDPVEMQGIERSRKAAAQAKVLIMVFDGSANWNDQDQKIVTMKQAEQGLVVAINKKDLKQKISAEGLKVKFPEKEIITTSAISGEGIKELEEALLRQLDVAFAPAVDNSIVCSMRHEEILMEALQNIEKAAEIIKGQPIELTSLELQHAWQKLGEITGDTLDETLLDRIFSEFCLGK